jgi:predicted amidohydrolase
MVEKAGGPATGRVPGIANVSVDRSRREYVVRVLLAAFRAAKGDAAGNLARHVELLERAWSEGCDVAVFPEFSLTGPVDPTRHPEHALSIDAGPVRELVAASHRTGVGVVFGIAERAGPTERAAPTEPAEGTARGEQTERGEPTERAEGTARAEQTERAEPTERAAPTGRAEGTGRAEQIERAGGGYYISQLYAHGGRLVGSYRKRHLGEDESGYHTGNRDGVFQLGAARFGLAICAEGGVDIPWVSAARAGAPVVFFCAAPGLYGRRTDEDGWRRGHAWWESAGLGDAIRHARRFGLWVAMATQAGSTQDEDFPGLAALVTPDGEVAARLPDWRPGVLVVDIPVDIVVRPVRTAVRALVVDDAGRALLVRFADEQAGTTWWSPPGGGVDAGEDDLAAVRRELREELGRDDFAYGPWIGRRTHTFQFGRQWSTQRERWILCRTPPFEPAAGLLPSLRAENVHELRWWTADEIRTAGILTTPRDLADLLDGVQVGRLPDAGARLGV